MTEKIDLKIWPEPILKRKALPVTVFDENLENIIIAMEEVIDQAEGVGLAAPQVGVQQRIVYYKVSNDRGYLVNPEIVSLSEEKQTIKEGCLSFPGVYITAERSKEAVVKYQDKTGEQFEKTFTNFGAQMIQHEVDHLDGVVFTKFLSKLKRDIVNKKMSKVRKEVERRWKEYEQAAKQQAATFTRKQTPGIGTPGVQEPTGRDSGLYDFSVPSEPPEEAS